MVKRSRDVAGQLSGELPSNEKNKIEVFLGRRFRDKNTVLVGKQVFNCENVLAQVQAQKILIFTDGDLIWEARAAMTPALCQNLLIIGAGAIGVEFASFYRTMDRGYFNRNDGTNFTC